jgi:hypothetical protein
LTKSGNEKPLYFHNTTSEHILIPEINPHCILSQIYAFFIEFYYGILVKDKNTLLKLPVGVSPLQLVKDWEL